ncbi:hypothetical protein V6N13_070265 [Hibiscus sabdariffa]|uniref:Uncharacterized protein n=1 Tax=Hibiscus sabdariffa TaxID=183260 RepID=A0ABR2THI9_9ROSI
MVLPLAVSLSSPMRRSEISVDLKRRMKMVYWAALPRILMTSGGPGSAGAGAWAEVVEQWRWEKKRSEKVKMRSKCCFVMAIAVGLLG